MKMSDALDGCRVAGTGWPTADHDVPYVVLFAAVDLADEAAVEARAAEWKALFDA